MMKRSAIRRRECSIPGAVLVKFIDLLSVHGIIQSFLLALHGIFDITLMRMGVNQCHDRYLNDCPGSHIPVGGIRRHEALGKKKYCTFSRGAYRVFDTV
jgi:hypothetical protein